MSDALATDSPDAPVDRSLDDLAAAGYVIDEWARWQQGGCLEYAAALLQLFPELRAGTLDSGGHFFAYDAHFAYDSAGRHPLPYLGVDGNMTPEMDTDLEWYDEPDPLEVFAAMGHIRRHRIGPERRDVKAAIS